MYTGIVEGAGEVVPVESGDDVGRQLPAGGAKTAPQWGTDGDGAEPGG